ncbi:hypothetical protein K3495_g9958 [Podosphaera aphanis]|nr:hypothetical protein K3495_g9958 [Podosphaera aphanis]
MESILRVQTALQAYTIHPEASKEWKNTLLYDLWWRKLKSLSLLFKPIHSSQKMSESNSATLAKVLPRWNRIDSHLRHNSYHHNCEFSQDINSYLEREGNGGWQSRRDKQLLPIHFTSFMLLPANSSHKLDISDQIKLEKSLREREDGHRLFQEWCQYIEKYGAFNITKDCWKIFKDEPKPFWLTVFWTSVEEADPLIKSFVREQMDAFLLAVASGHPMRHDTPIQPKPASSLPKPSQNIPSRPPHSPK